MLKLQLNYFFRAIIGIKSGQGDEILTMRAKNTALSRFTNLDPQSDMWCVNRNNLYAK